MKFAKFMSNMSGRVLRAIAGIILIIVGLSMKSTGGYILSIVGLLPLAAGAFDFCLLAKLIRLPLRGKEIRAL